MTVIEAFETYCRSHWDDLVVLRYRVAMAELRETLEALGELDLDDVA